MISTAIFTASAAVVSTFLVVRAARRSFVSAPGTFRCTFRVVEDGHSRRRRPRRVRITRGRWVHTVLLLLGPFGHVRAIGVRFPDGSLTKPVRPAARLGKSPVALMLLLDDGRLTELAAPGSARAEIVGPFIAAAVDNAAVADATDDRRDCIPPLRHGKPPGEPR
jgi:hypothetical protein